MNTIRFDIDADGIATLTIDVPGQSMNVIGPDFLADLDGAITRIASEEGIKGAVIASGKDSGFMAGMDLKYFGSMLASADGQRPAPTAPTARPVRFRNLKCLSRSCVWACM